MWLRILTIILKWLGKSTGHKDELDPSHSKFDIFLFIKLMSISLLIVLFLYTNVRLYKLSSRVNDYDIKIKELKSSIKARDKISKILNDKNGCAEEVDLHPRPRRSNRISNIEMKALH
jgi:hypothetical protein